MANLVIVAIPREDDYVWKISSEKVPHLTICFLGEATTNPNVARIMLFLEHAVKLWERGPFGLSVDHREDAFGPDEADVLVFKKDWAFKELEIFRNQLLKNTDIRNAYDSVEQYPEFIPHMTMGYPETPAKEDTREFPGVRWVEFDRIALWFGNYEGPEFRLEYNWEIEEVMMSTRVEAGEEFVKHFGVKGMKWGIRRGGITSTGPARDVTVRTTHGPTGKLKVKTKGGQLHEVAPDAVDFHTTRQKMKRSGVDALSNAEMRKVVERMNLEQQLNSLSAKRPKSLGEKAVEETLKDPVKTAQTVKKTAKVAKDVAIVSPIAVDIGRHYLKKR